jgi:hypothetical protein
MNTNPKLTQQPAQPNPSLRTQPKAPTPKTNNPRMTLPKEFLREKSAHKAGINHS